MNEKSIDDLLASPFDLKTSIDIPTNTVVATAGQSILETLEPTYQEKAHEIAAKLNENDLQSINTYGVGAQSQLADFSQTLLKHVQNKDTQEVGEVVSNLMYQLKQANPDDLSAKNPSIFNKFFNRIKQSIFEMTAKYQKIGAQVDQIAARLAVEEKGLMADNESLEGLYQQNKNFFTALNVYIAAGQLKLEDLHTKIIPETRKKVEVTQDQMAIQELNDLQRFAERLDKRTHDLLLTRQMVIQQAPQIRLIQQANQILSEKIQASIHTAIPLWKNQIAIALTLLHQRQALTMQRQVTETTNDLLRKNSNMLKSSSIEIAEENERGIIDIETLQHTQNNLIETLEETLRIQQTGFSKRRAAEKELEIMENTLKNKLLEISANEQFKR